MLEGSRSKLNRFINKIRENQIPISASKINRIEWIGIVNTGHNKHYLINFNNYQSFSSEKK